MSDAVPRPRVEAGKPRISNTELQTMYRAKREREGNPIQANPTLVDMTVQEKAKRRKVQNHEWYLKRKGEIEALKLNRERELAGDSPIEIAIAG